MSRKIRGIIAGSFDVIHPGYAMMFADAMTVCDYLTVALHEDPSAERPNKEKPIFSVEDRMAVLSCIRGVIGVVVYQTEADLTKLLESGKWDVHITGTDHQGEPARKIKTYYHERNHEWSATKYKRMIRNAQ